MQRNFILVSPGPVGGYPPVQYQARLLADSGHRVEVVTMPLRGKQPSATFTHPHVQVTCIDKNAAYGGRLRRNSAFYAAVFAARGRVNRSTAVEIAYDPIGLFFSDVVPRRPNHRIAHLHELLRSPDEFLEKRLRRTIKAYDLVVVADQRRASHTQETLKLETTPIVMENYPLLGTRPIIASRDDQLTPFEVIYCGSLGYNQKLDVIIRSITQWPKQATFTLIGNDQTPIARELAALARDVGVADRVRFAGWMDVRDAEARLSRAHLAIALFDTNSEQLRTALGASNKRYQYMKAGLPQIGDHNPGVPELIERNGIGLCVPEHRIDAIASAVRSYVNYPARRAAEGTRAFDLHRRVYHYERVFQRLLDAVNLP